MKKILAMLLALVMVLSLAACASTQPAAEPVASSDAPRRERKDLHRRRLPARAA